MVKLHHQPERKPNSFLSVFVLFQDFDDEGWVAEFGLVTSRPGSWCEARLVDPPYVGFNMFWHILITKDVDSLSGYVMKWSIKWEAPRPTTIQEWDRLFKFKHFSHGFVHHQQLANLMLVHLNIPTKSLKVRGFWSTMILIYRSQHIRVLLLMDRGNQVCNLSGMALKPGKK
jgi:hypothetical protein